MVCIICEGRRHISLPTHTPVEPFLIDSVPSIDESYKNYPCPECTPVFYPHDLHRFNAVEPLYDNKGDDLSYVNHVRNRVAMALGRLAFRDGAIRFRIDKDARSPYSPREQEAHIGDMYVVKNSAKGWFAK